MPFRRPSCIALARHSAVVAILLLPAACERTGSGTRADSLASSGASPGGASVPALDRSGWNRAAGPALFVQGSALDEAVAVFPYANDTLDQERLDSMGVEGTALVLFGRGGTRLGARLGALPDETDIACERWLLRDVSPQGGTAAWAIGFADARATPVALDSVDVLSPRDSAALAAEASRLASAVTAETGPSFQGLRFSAHDLRRFEAAPGVQALVAHLVRNVNQEANAQEEQTLLIAERDSGVTTGPYQLAYAERSFGREEKVVTLEVLAGARFGGTAQPTLVVARDGEAGVAYAFVERTGTRQWRVRWTSALSKCG